MANRDKMSPPQMDAEMRKKMDTIGKQMETQQMLMLSLLSRFVKASERIADCMEKAEARAHRIEYPANDAKNPSPMVSVDGHA